ncbi:MAG TPA: serine hydrolase domain-containing protein [Caulobacteraceae bacterium]|nr:serine hydrolase domain-containing protein [Caulobacteraceae bacterium]
MADGSVAGFVGEKFPAVREAFENNLESGLDIGASFAATKDGQLIVDLWGGWADEAKTRPWEKDTIVNVYSTTKTMTALTALLVADRGELDFGQRVAHYWPEFAQNGKADIKVSHLMSHSSGLAGWEEKVTMEDMYDWEKATSLLAAQAPWWEPGTQSGYHAMTQGYLVGEVIRRVTGKTVGTVFREEIAEPLGADFHIGLPASEDARVADLIPPPPGSRFGDGEVTGLMKKMTGNPDIDVMATRTRAWRCAEIPAAGGTGNARSVAIPHTILANGGLVKGKRFMSEAGVRKALEPQISGNDLILNAPITFGMGFGLPGDLIPVPNKNTIFWGGYGGSLILIDLDARTTIAYVMNKMGMTTLGDTRAFNMAGPLWAGLAAA